MIESELFALLEQTADAAYTVTERGEIRSWNQAAEQLFGYSRAEVLGRHIDDVFDAYDSLGTEPLLGGADSAARDPKKSGYIRHFDLDVRTKSGARLWVNLSTIVFDNHRTGRRLLVRLARDMTQARLNEIVLSRMVGIAQQAISASGDASQQAPAETITTRELRTLQLFADGHTSAAVARKLGITAQTLRNHLHKINRKLRTHSRLEAVTHAQRRGLIK
jgi:PAS domain S-box-containing protein